MQQGLEKFAELRGSGTWRGQDKECGETHRRHSCCVMTAHECLRPRRLAPRRRDDPYLATVPELRR